MAKPNARTVGSAMRFRAKLVVTATDAAGNAITQSATIQIKPPARKPKPKPL